MKTALWIIGVCFAALFFWWTHTPEIQWWAARSHIGKIVTVVGPVIEGTLDSSIVTMTMGIPNCESPTSNWQSSLHIAVPRNILSREWTQKDLEKGTVMKWTGRVEIGIGNSVWLIVAPYIHHNLLSLNTLLGFLSFFAFGWIAFYVFLTYYESNRSPFTERSEQNKRDIARSVRRCSFTGGFVVAVCWLAWFVNT
jgi:hypothetical protein